VRTAWADILGAKATVDSQKENIGRAERTIQLARERYLAGTGIQVDILSAQTALTQTRGNYVQALRDYSVAYSRLLRATGEDVQHREGQ
jgi:outer membrane protein TolC